MSRRIRLQNLYHRSIHPTSTQTYPLVHPFSRKTLYLTSQHPPRAIPRTSQAGHICCQALHHTGCHHYQACLEGHSNPFLQKHSETLLSIGYPPSL